MLDDKNSDDRIGSLESKMDALLTWARGNFMFELPGESEAAISEQDAKEVEAKQLVEPTSVNVDWGHVVSSDDEHHDDATNNPQ